MELHALTLASHSYALLIGLVAYIKDLQEIVSQLPCEELSKEQISCLARNLELQEEGLSKNQMNLRSICHRWMSKYPNQCCLENLVQALICTEGLGRYVSGITCKFNRPTSTGGICLIMVPYYCLSVDQLNISVVGT